jgi:hypothetical protein
MNNKGENYLNTVLGVYLLLDIFAYDWLRVKVYWVEPLFAFVPILLAAWSYFVALHRKRHTRPPMMPLASYRR